MDRVFGKIIQTIFSWTALCLIFKYGIKLASSKNIKIGKKSFVSKRIIGYTSANMDSFKGMMFICLIISMIITVYFFVCGLLGFKDVDGNSVFAHSMIFFILFSFCGLLFVYTDRCKIYFNKDEIIRYRLIRQKQVVKYDEVKTIVVRKNYGIILITDTTKLLFNEDYSNYNKFIKLLEEKNFDITYVNLFGKRI